MVGQSLQETLVCTADATPPATITWLRPDLTLIPVDPSTNAPQLVSLSRSDEGTYTCLASNSAGEVSTEFFITVHGKCIL